MLGQCGHQSENRTLDLALVLIRITGFLIDADDKMTAYRHELFPVMHEFGE